MRLLKSHGFNVTSHRIVSLLLFTFLFNFYCLLENKLKDSNSQALKPLDRRTLIKKGQNREYKDQKVIQIE